VTKNSGGRSRRNYQRALGMKSEGCDYEDFNVHKIRIDVSDGKCNEPHLYIVSKSGSQRRMKLLHLISKCNTLAECTD
jgi:hypothetical protein